MTAERSTCIILAGGSGSRLRSSIPDLPKCLAPVGGRAFLEIQIESLVARGFNDFVLSLGYMAHKVRDHIARNGLPARIRIVEEPRPLGTGGAIAYAMDAIERDEAVVINGDTFLSGNLSLMQTPLALSDGEWFRMALVMLEKRTRFGGVAVDACGRVVGFLEKGDSGPGLINAGCYRLKRRALPDAIAAGSVSLEADCLPGLVASGHVRAAMVGGTFTDIGVPQDYRTFCDDLERCRHGQTRTRGDSDENL